MTVKKRRPNRLSACIRGVVTTFESCPETDQELLQRFFGQRDEAAFSSVVRRHGPMVLRVAQRTLQNEHDAEDVFQSTFLVLSQKGHTLRRQESLASWLYGIAYRLALKSKAKAGERRDRERRVAAMPAAHPLAQITVQEAQTILDGELNRLPKKLREPVVLCCLEGLARDEASQQLGCPIGVLKSRLEQARERLRQRLIARGLTLPCGLGAFLLLEGASKATVPPALISSTIKAASAYAAGQAVAAGVISPKVAALTQGVLKAMMITKIKTVVAVVLVLGFLVTGATVLSVRTGARANQPPAAEAPMKTPEKLEKEKEPFTAWGKEVGGLQAGLGYRPGAKRAYHHGETVAVVLRIRNVSKEAVAFEHIWAFFVENPPTITDADGKTVELLKLKALGRQMPRSTNVAPGKEVELYEWTFDLRPQGESGNKGSLTIHGTGKFSLQCERIVGPTSGNPNHPNPAMSKLATGKLELEIKSDPPATPEKKDPPKQEKEGFTAWGKELDGRGLHMGKEVDGLQAGLGFRPGEKRAYSHGETVKLVVRVRNVGKKEVTFNYIPGYFFDWPPSVTDGEGKPAPQIRFPGKGRDHNPKELTLAPGKEVELAELKIELRPESESGNNKENTLYGTGKFQIHYERLMYSSGAIDIRSILRDLATGKLELEIKSAEKK